MIYVETHHDASLDLKYMIPELSHPILDDTEDKLYEYLNEKVPHMPPEAKTSIVKFMPVGLVIIIVAQLASIMSFFHVNSVFEGLGYLYGMSEGIIGVISVILLTLAVLLEAVSIPLLLKHKILGWRYVFYAVLLAAINDLVTVNLINFVFGGALLLYVLFQVRDNYR